MWLRYRHFAYGSTIKVHCFDHSISCSVQKCRRKSFPNTIFSRSYKNVAFAKQFLFTILSQRITFLLHFDFQYDTVPWFRSPLNEINFLSISSSSCFHIIDESVATFDDILTRRIFLCSRSFLNSHAPTLL
jgi:hypothetical protein